MILEGKKQQSIRLFNKRWKSIYSKWLNGKSYSLQLYWKQRSKNGYKLLEKPLKELIPIFLRDIIQEIAIADGFNTLEECQNWFRTKYKKVDFEIQVLVIIKWEFNE